MQRVYFNSPVLQLTKVWAQADGEGRMVIKSRTADRGYTDATEQGFIETAENTGVAEIEKLIGKPVAYETKFADVWAAVK